jgi:hypothetical protein
MVFAEWRGMFLRYRRRLCAVERPDKTNDAGNHATQQR